MPDSSYPSIGKSHFVATIFGGVDDKGLRAYKGRVNDVPIDTPTTANTDQGETGLEEVGWSSGPLSLLKAASIAEEWQRPTETTEYVDV